MSSVEFDMGNAPSVLAALRNPGNAQRVANAAAESYVTDMLDWIEAGHAFAGRTGQLEQSIGWRPAGNGSADVYVNSDYAGFVERGTGIHAGHQPWVIRPRDRQALRFPVGGGSGFGFARSVTHRGSKPHPFFFADSAARSQHMQAAGLSVLARIMSV